MNTPPFRHEYKLSINLSDYFSIKQRVSAVAGRDPNAGEDGRYHIRSLYFDNYCDKALREKLCGLPNREKFRLRLYNGKSDFIRLEKKSKANGLTLKQSAVLTRDQAERLLRGETGWMLDSDEPLLVEFYGKMRSQLLRPKTIVDYDREAYAYPCGNVRVTFDSGIRSGVYSTGLFDEELPTLEVCPAGVLLMEVKYDSYLPDLIRDMLQTNTRRTEAFSKYAACRIYG